MRPFHGTDALLDRGYVFLTDPEMQAGLDAAAQELSAVRQSLGAITDRLDVIDFGDVTVTEPPRVLAPRAPVDARERQERLAGLIEAGIVPEAVAKMGDAVQDRAIVAGEAMRAASSTPLFADELPEHRVEGVGTARVPAVPRQLKAYRLRTELGVPKALWQELGPDFATYNDPAFLDDVARGFCDRADLLKRLAQRNQAATVALRDLFLADERSLAVSLRMSANRIAEQAQAAFNFNPSIDPRLLKRALLKLLEQRAFLNGFEAEFDDLVRAIDLAALQQPEALADAVKHALAGFKRATNAEPIPDPMFEPDGCTACAARPRTASSPRA